MNIAPSAQAGAAALLSSNASTSHGQQAGRAAQTISTGQDRFELSSEADDALSVLAGLPPISVPSAGELAVRQSQLTDRIQSLLADKGIDTSNELQLRVGSDGRIAASASHPQSEEIKKILSEEPGLREQFVRVTVDSEVRQAVEDSIAFRDAYEKNPDQAVKDFEQSLSQRRARRFTISIQNENVKSFFAS